MKKLLLTLLTTLVLNAALAGPEDDALEARARKDFATVLKIVRPPALRGEAWAQSSLADLYARGDGVAQNYAEAARWYRLAAQQDDPMAQFWLGYLYIDGQGVVQDYAKAHMWFNLSSAKGYLGSRKFRDDVAKVMTPQQIAEAQKMARDCQEQRLKGCD